MANLFSSSSSSTSPGSRAGSSFGTCASSGASSRCCNQYRSKGCFQTRGLSTSSSRSRAAGNTSIHSISRSGARGTCGVMDCCRGPGPSTPAERIDHQLYPQWLLSGALTSHRNNHLPGELSPAPALDTVRNRVMAQGPAPHLREPSSAPAMASAKPGAGSLRRTHSQRTFTCTRTQELAN